MSDALSEISKDFKKMELINQYHQLLAQYMLEKTEERYNELKSLTQYIDSLGQGYWLGRTRLYKRLDRVIEKLKQKDKVEWARLMVYQSNDESVYERLKQISPFQKYYLTYVRLSLFDIELAYKEKGIEESEWKRKIKKVISLTDDIKEPGSYLLEFDQPSINLEYLVEVIKFD